jgi:hypothetical protein
MHHAHRYVATLFLAAAFAGPMSVLAVPSPQVVTAQVRVYDRTHKDYHNWDEHESQAWGVYLTNNHRPIVVYSKARRSDQDGYWNWRHAHPDGK